MFDPINHLQIELAELVGHHTHKEGSQSTAIPSLSFSRCSAPYHSTSIEPPYRLNNPSLCIVVQGFKDIILGEDRFSYGPPNYLIASMDLPMIAEVREASSKVPNLSCKIEFSHSQILELLNDDELKVNAKRKSKRGLNVSELDASMLGTVVNLVRLLDKPADIPVLAPLFIKKFYIEY